MILKESFSIEHINSIKVKYPTLDKQLIERTIFALGLLESLAKVPHFSLQHPELPQYYPLVH